MYYVYDSLVVGNIAVVDISGHLAMINLASENQYSFPVVLFGLHIR